MDKIANKQKKFNFIFRLIVIVLLSVFLVGLILFVNVIEIKIINHIKQSVVQEFENNTGFHVSYDRISPNILTSLDIYDVVLTNNQGVRLELGTIEVGYSLLKAVFIPTSEIGAFVILKNIKLKDFHLDVTKNHFDSLVEMLQKQFASRKKGNSSDFIKKIKGITFEIPFASIIFHEQQSEISINIKNLKSSVSNAMNILGEINVCYLNRFNNKATIECKINGKIFNENQLLQTDIDLNISKIIFAKTTIKNLDFNLKSVGSNFTIKKLQNAMDFDLEFSKQAEVILAKVNMQLQHSELQTLITGEYVDKFLPDEVKIKTNIKCDLAKNKLLNGDLQFDATGKNYMCFDNASLTCQADVVDNSLHIIKCNFFTNDSQKFLSLDGNIPIFENSRQIKLVSNNFTFRGIQTLFSIDIEQKKDNIFVTSSDIKVGDSFLGSFRYKIAFDKNNIHLITEKPLNGYSIFGSIVSDKKNNKNIYITNKFEKSSINKFVQIVKSDLIPPEQEFVFDGAIDMNFVGKKFTIENSFFNVLKKNKTLQSMLSASFEMRDNNFEIKKMTILDGKINCGGTVFYKNQMLNSNLTMMVDSKKNKNVVYNLNAEMDKKNIKISVNNLAKLSLNLLTKKLLLSSNNFPLFINDHNVYVSCNSVADLSKKIINDTDFTINQLKLFNNKSGKFTGKLNYSDNILRLSNCSYSDGSNNLTGSLTNNFFDFSDIKKNVSQAKNNGTKFDINKLRLSGNGLFVDDNKKESYSFDYFIQEGNVDAKLYLTNMALVKLGVDDLNGLLNVRLHAIGKLTNPIIDVQGEIYKGHFGKNKLDATFVIKKDMQQINVKKAVVNLSTQIKNQTFTINNSYCTIGSGYKNVNLATNVYLKQFGKITKADLSVTGGFTEFKKDTNFAFDIGVKNISVAYLKVGVPFESEKFDGVKFSLKHLDNKYSLFNYGQKFIDIAIDTVKHNGYAYIYNEKKQIFACNVTNDVEANNGEGNITGKARFIHFPANVAHRIVFPFVGIEDGLIDGELKIGGSLKEPKINGRASLYYGQATLQDYLPDPISNITGIIVFDNNKILVNNVNGMVKKGLVHANGQIVFNKRKFENLHFDITSNTIPTKINQGPVDIVGVGHLDSFAIDGHPGSYNFAGNITVESAEVNLSNFGTMSKGKNSKTPRVYPLNVELNLIAGDKVKVNYPIINVHVKQGEVFTFHYAGNEPAIYLGGEVNVEKGTLNYFNKEFKIENASFTFFDDEQKINPFVNLKSYYRTKDSKNSNVMVYLTINDRLSSFKTNVSAIPYKSVSEINSILGTSFATNDDEREVYNDFNYTPDIESVVNTTNYLSSAFMFSPVENALKRVTGFDTFSVNTSIFGNMIKSNNNWLDLIDDTQLSFGKYLTNEIYVGSVMSFQKLTGTGTDHLFLPFQDNNYGINMELFMQLELPYLSIGYKFMPKDYSNILKAEHQISVEANFKF